MPDHLCRLDDLLLASAAGVEPRLLISMPPRHGKSWLCSRYFPAWFLGRHPNRRVILTSYEAGYAAEWGDATREVLKRQGHLFGVKIRDDRAARDNWQLEGHEGGMVTAGAGGPITGRGADLLIIDDPFKNAEEAMSETIRKKVWDWFISTAYTRLEPDGRIVIIQTRWHEDDLIGRALSMKEENWRYVNFPALAESNDPLGRKQGMALWPQRYAEHALHKIKAADGTGYWFSAMYQGSPSPMGGGMFKRQWFRYAEKNGSPTLFKLGDTWRNIRDARRFCTVDLAASTKTSADFTVIATGVSFPDGSLLVLDVRQERLEGPDIIPAIRANMNAWNCGDVWIERIGFQTALVQDARRQGLPVRELNPDKDKVTRAAPLAALFAAGKVYFAPGDWRTETERELLSFPAGAHDDIVDALAYLCRVHNEHLGESFKRFALKL